MAKQSMMQRFAKWHIWLGWLVGAPILMWLVTGLFMVAKPIEEVRGNHLRVEAKEQALSLPGGAAPTTGPIREMRAFMQHGRAISRVEMMDGSVRRYDLATGERIAPLDALAARSIAETEIKGGDRVASVTLFEADEVPFDFRKPMPVWQVVLEDGAHVYIGRDTGEIEAVRTRWWRAFDVMWGLHIMDLQTREDTSHPILILFAFLGSIGALIGCVLMFRRRKARAATGA
ncbi:PepSY domain-containing protein [Parerythrobacter lacustris]|uniref:PepSY domain-containing protein n=1 Tax=Parerythrobacter lacustris TaxID=2969984 RepID=A0ABT1XQR4_9SPHN|nr:PepSY domain-containing protein [Parerythrobacter lacustris]MCR2833572.1 PepSY domain-containing protein [Parerythrobacter lacustris]